jgi:hypothetical protein
MPPPPLPLLENGGREGDGGSSGGPMAREWGAEPRPSTPPEPEPSPSCCCCRRSRWLIGGLVC